MELVIAEDYDRLSRMCAERVLDTVRRKPDAVLCMPTGNTPLGLYRQLTQADTPPGFWERVRIVCLDEYWGVGPEDDHSLIRWLMNVLIKPLRIPEHAVYRFAQTQPTPEAICREYEERISGLGPIDLCVLGLGPNGHVGFNEPGSDPASRTHCLKLAKETLVSNSAYWGGEAADIPPYGLTLGLGNILESKEILMLVSGPKKADILQKLIQGPETPNLPASFLKRSGRATIVADRSAVALL